MAVLVMASELTHMLAHPKIPQLNHVVCTPRQERIVSLWVRKRSLEKFDCMRVSLMTIIQDLNRLVRVCIIDD